MDANQINLSEQIGRVGKILDTRQKNKGVLIHMLQQIQKEEGYLPLNVLISLSSRLRIPLSEIHSVASFYKMFYFRPRGRKIVKVCLGTACYVRGSKKVLLALENEFNIKNGETTEDFEMTLDTVGCVGCCGLAPVTTVNNQVQGEIVGQSKVADLIRSIRSS
ncbi:MAG: NAD(P)H-dependent oxidoreductase subunit E [Nitrospirota bacterium]